MTAAAAGAASASVRQPSVSFLDRYKADLDARDAARRGDSPPLTGESDTPDPTPNTPKLVPRFDYFQASVRAPYGVLSEGLIDAFATDRPQFSKGFHGYDLGWSIPTRERGTLTVNPAGIHEYPSVRVSGWPSDDVVAYLRAHWDGQASRVDAAVDFAGDLTAWCQVLQLYAEVKRVKWNQYHVGTYSTGLELGAGKSESRTRCYDATLKHPGEFPGPTGRLEHEWKPSQKARKVLAYGLDAATVLGTSRAAAMAIRELAGTALPAAPPRTERMADLDAWLIWIRGSQGARIAELLERNGGDPVLTIFELLGYEEDETVTT